MIQEVDMTSECHYYNTYPFIQNTPSNLIATNRQFEPLNATVKQIEN